MTLRVFALAEQHWTRLEGWATSRGLDLDRMGVGRFSRLVQWWAVQGAESEADLAKFEAQLWRPPVGVAAPRGPWSPAAENAALGGWKTALGK